MNARSISKLVIAVLTSVSFAHEAKADGEEQLNAMIEAGQITIDRKLIEPLGDLGNRDLAVVRVELAPGVTEPRHTHPGIEVLYGLEGSGFVEIDRSERTLITPGSVVKVAPGSVKALINESSDETFTVIAVLLIVSGEPVIELEE